MRFQTARRYGRRGYALIAFSISLPFLLGMVGLAIDIGRMYITKNETQSYVDAAALAAVIQLDGTQDGITRAVAAVGSTPKKWQFGTSSFNNIQTTFGTSSTGPWNASPPSPPAGYYFAQVAATAQLPIYFLRVLTGQGISQIGATAVAGRATTNSMNGGEFPFSPYTRQASPDNASDPFGFQIGNQYTLRWGAPGTITDCGTDATQPNLSSQGSIRGYCCAGSASSIRAAIVGGRTDSVSIGDPVPMDPGAKQTEMSAIAMRVVMDTDTTSTTYSQYRSLAQGNGMRVVVTPINSGPATNYTAVGFAGFFLLNFNYYDGLKGGNNSACAEYIGAWVQGVPSPPPGGAGAFHLKLYY